MINNSIRQIAYTQNEEKSPDNKPILTLVLSRVRRRKRKESRYPGKALQLHHRNSAALFGSRGGHLRRWGQLWAAGRHWGHLLQSLRIVDHYDRLERRQQGCDRDRKLVRHRERFVGPSVARPLPLFLNLTPLSLTES